MAVGTTAVARLTTAAVRQASVVSAVSTMRTGGARHQSCRRGRRRVTGVSGRAKDGRTSGGHARPTNGAVRRARLGLRLRLLLLMRVLVLVLVLVLVAVVLFRGCFA